MSEYYKLLLLPCQLFKINILPTINFQKPLDLKITLWECPHYFKKYNYNKKKIMLHKASMEYYYNYLKSKGLQVKYVKLEEGFTIKNYYLMDPGDSIKILNLPGPPIILDSPSFLLSNDFCEELEKARGSKKFYFNSFYSKSKTHLNIIKDIKSKDKDNRKRLPPGTKIPKLPKLSNMDIEYINAAKLFVDAKFNTNLGNTEEFMFPVTHKTAEAWLAYFIKFKFKNFGDYQDFINKDDAFMFHSLLSTSLNIGLLTPKRVIEIIVKQISPVNSLEGFIRQLFWREYQRYTYKFVFSKTKNFNHFNNSKMLSKKWYTGGFNVEPLDDAITKGIKTGYLAHIDRLMIIGNFMNLSFIKPSQGFKWFMEFSCDSYEWVMYQNVYGMAFYADGGLTMRRPYLSSSNYIIKMSNYPKGAWCDIWDTLYKNFLKKNKKKLKHTIYKT